MSKITVKTPLVEMNGDEMTRIIWDLIKEKIVKRYLEIDLREYDLHVQNRDRTDDQVTIDAAHAIREFKVGVKCATITPDADRVEEYKLKKAWRSPNGTIRNILNGTIFRKPITVNNIHPYVRSWKKPIVIGRHAYGDLYRSVELRIDGPASTSVVSTHDGKSQSVPAFDFAGPGIFMGIHNTDESIRSFAQSSIAYAASEKMDLWFSVKDTISKTYHARFKDIFQEEVDAAADTFAAAGISYRYLLIDDAVAQAIKHPGGFVWALSNYDGDVMSDLIAAGFGSLGMMTSVLVSPSGAFEYEAAHGTVKRHYYQHLEGKATSTNSVASMFAWTGALRKRGELDATPELVKFAETWERAVLSLIEEGVVTKDLTALIDPPSANFESTQSFIDKVSDRLETLLSASS
ncbi:MAG: NADP-dependent isocitrate dehydrogenase [Myxococcota bacterium]|jgi:isocitrate dehydrogenase|nr:NADP-dependent isocitrate dehydrogenase [Myxococcota bacterium]